MPRKKITISDKVEYLSILDEKGQLDKKLEPDIPEDVLLQLHRAMLLARKFDERLLNLQKAGPHRYLCSYKRSGSRTARHDCPSAPR